MVCQRRPEPYLIAPSGTRVNNRRITGIQPKYNRNTTEQEPNNNQPPRDQQAIATCAYTGSRAGVSLALLLPRMEPGFSLAES